MFPIWGFPLVMYTPGGGGGGGQAPYFHYEPYAKKGEGVQVACGNADIIDGRSLCVLV